MGSDYNTGLPIILGRQLYFHGRPRTSTFERGGRGENEDVSGRQEMYQGADESAGIKKEDGDVLQKPGH